MTLRQMKIGAAALWVGAVGAGGALASVSSVSGWIVVAGCALLPLLMVNRYWKDPDETMSERIQQALR
jgi:hypothetical protein